MLQWLWQATPAEDEANVEEYKPTIIRNREDAKRNVEKETFRGTLQYGLCYDFDQKCVSKCYV